MHKSSAHACVPKLRWPRAELAFFLYQQVQRKLSIIETLQVFTTLGSHQRDPPTPLTHLGFWLPLLSTYNLLSLKLKIPSLCHVIP